MAYETTLQLGGPHCMVRNIRQSTVVFALSKMAGRMVVTMHSGKDGLTYSRTTIKRVGIGATALQAGDIRRQFDRVTMCHPSPIVEMCRHPRPVTIITNVKLDTYRVSAN